MEKPKVKICCITSVREAKLAIDCGASALGLVGPMPSGPGIIEDRLIKQIAYSIQAPTLSFLLTSETTAQGIIDHHKRTQTKVIQIVDEIELSAYEKIKAELPDIELMQVIHVTDECSIEQAICVSKFVDGILLDSGNPNLSTKVLGGTGRVHNWQLSREIVKSVTSKVFLAGGINKDNVKEAIQSVKPYGIDLCSGVRTNSQLDEKKLTEFFDAVNS